MRESFASLLATGAGRFALSLLLASAPLTSAFTFKQVASPNLDLDDLGRIAFAGDFDAISLYEYEGQTQETPSRNGTLLSRYPNGVFASINTTDADIKAMCSLNINGTERVVFAGNFTSVGTMPTPGGIALLNTTTGQVQALAGLDGSVNTLFCDKGADQVYVGGLFRGLNSTNAIVWKNGWQELSFAGFNGAVHSIAKTSNGNIIFGGEFNGLGSGNATVSAENATQIIPISSANISAQTSSGLPGFTDPKVIACKSDFKTQGADQTWLLSDNAPGFWKADFGFGFEPTRLNMYNTDYQNRGTKTWRFTALPDGGIMNMSYVDPSNGRVSYCDARCPLPERNTTAQEFTFVNVVGMNSFRIDVSDWYGSGAGLNGIQLFQDAIYSYAINDFNEPANCGPTTARSESTRTGNWQNTPSHNSYSQYLTATLQGSPIDPASAAVTFLPDLKQSGNYSVTIYTPGCQGDGTCGTRGRVNVTASMSQGASEQTEFWQTNNFDKYDEVYRGYIDATSGFRPNVVLRPGSGQGPTVTFVAQRVRFTLLNATSGNINGLFEFKPGQSLESQDVASSVINSAGASLEPRENAFVTSLATDGQNLYVAGNFSSNDGRNNIFTVRRDATNPSALPGRGLNSQVMTMYQIDSTLYVGGNFTNTVENNAQGLGGVAALVNNQWRPLGAGVNGVVLYLVPFALNITANRPEQVLAVSGFFNRVNAFGNNSATNVQDFAVWVPSRGNWLHNLDFYSLAMSGRLMTFADVTGGDRWFGGSVSSGSLLASGTAELQSNGGDLSLGAFPVDLQAQREQTASRRKRAILQGQDLNTTGVRTGTFYKENGNNKTILAGHFATTGADGQNITNVIIIDGGNGDRITGFGEQLDANSTFTALAVSNNILFAGGMVTGQLNNNRVAGLVTYDLGSNNFASAQPPPLQGQNVTVNSISPRPKSNDIYVGGRFQSAGALTCAAVCIWNTDRSQWTSPGNGLSGEVSSLTWVSDNKLYIAGNLTSGNNVTTILSFDSSSNQFTAVPGASNLPGPVNALTIATGNGNELWAAGTATNGSAYLHRFDGQNWMPVNSSLFDRDTDIRGIQVLSLSENHGSADLIDQGQDLLLMGTINIRGFGTVSGALYNGTNLIPFLLATKGADGQTTDGSLSSIFVENPNSFFMQSNKHLALWAIVLIGLAIALVLTFLLVVAGIILEWYRKKAKGYSPAPQSYPDRLGNVGRLPPEQLFGTLQGPRAPAI
ncbi:cortical protein marker for cell polarity-domain-containing protein [Paraphoma chrysanthemicola]|uniref:Cortical protein marker for cell polarity-domain-containing protein n=1 Tax=Paraphoma chrysanthemicola TaxID=798071 RepID=A0A8K0R447_9PLEO|nr:cortical protein marker for cell polarity-domain-containing protein [Paraphoma chrysanthemicola]